MRPSAALLVIVLLAVSSVAGVGVAHPTDDRMHALNTLHENGSSGSVVSESTLSMDLPTNSTANDTGTNMTTHDETEMYVSLHEDGNARWNVTARFSLGNQNETAAFRKLAENYENRNANGGFSARTFERMVEHATTAENRQMAIQDDTQSARLVENGSVGVLSLSFTWTNFTQVKENRIVMDDVFTTESGTWLPALTDDQTLIIEAPVGYVVWNSPQNKGVINGTRLQYEGSQSLTADELSATYKPRVQTTPTTTTTPSGGFPDLSGPSGVIVVLFLFSAGGVGAYAWSQRRGADPVDDSDADGVPPTIPTVDADDNESDTNNGTDNSEEDERGVELLSDEERVLRLLQDNDGRMKQAQIVKETNWSNAKVSQLLSKMDGDDDVDKLRIGRENLITLPDEDVTDTE